MDEQIDDSVSERRRQILAKLAETDPEDRLPWIREQEFEEAGRPYFEWFGWEKEDIWPELLDDRGIPIPTVYTGCKIGRVNISIRESDRNPGPGKRIKPGYKVTMNDPIPAVQCTYVKPNGQRCSQWSIKGLSVCYVHGGKTDIARKQADEVVTAARMRIFQLTDQALDVLDRVTRQGSTAPDAVQVKAATELLDRAGLKMPTEIEVSVEHKVDPSVAIFENLDKLAENRKALSAEDESDIIDAEIVIEVDDEAV